MLPQFYSVPASPSSLTLEVRAIFFELCVHDWQALVRRALLSGDSSCYAGTHLIIELLGINGWKEDNSAGSWLIKVLLGTNRLNN